MRLLLLTAAVLLGAACASQELPYDAPQVGVNGVAQVLGVERYGSYETTGWDVEVVIWRTIREDGRECDEIAFKVVLDLGLDIWLSTHHQRHSVLGMFSGPRHYSLPDAICLHADVAGVQR